MKKEIKSIEITDESEIAKLADSFKEMDNKVSTRVYNSITEEKLRTAKISRTKLFKKDLDLVKKVFFNLLTHDLHPDLKFEDLKQDHFYRTSGRMGKIPFLIKTITDSEIVIIWFNKEQKFIRQVRIKPYILNKNKVSVRYSDFVTGVVSIAGYFEKRIRSTYIRRQKIAFEMQCLTAKKELFQLTENGQDKIDKKIARMLKYSKELF